MRTQRQVLHTTEYNEPDATTGFAPQKIRLEPWASLSVSDERAWTTLLIVLVCTIIHSSIVVYLVCISHSVSLTICSYIYMILQLDTIDTYTLYCCKLSDQKSDRTKPVGYTWCTSNRKNKINTWNDNVTTSIMNNETKYLNTRTTVVVMAAEAAASYFLSFGGLIFSVFFFFLFMSGPAWYCLQHIPPW